MPYTTPESMAEVAAIIEDFDEASLKDIFKSQISSDTPYTTLVINHFQPINYSYKKALTLDMEEEALRVIKTRYFNICSYIISSINDKFNLGLDFSWVSDDESKIPAIAFSLYQFFVLDIYNNIKMILSNYINENMKELVEVFSDSAKEIISKSSMNLNVDGAHGVINICIFDICDYAFNNLDTETIVSYCDPKYTPAIILKKMTEENIITGDYVRILASEFKDIVALRSMVTFDLVLQFNPGLSPEKLSDSDD